MFMFQFKHRGWDIYWGTFNFFDFFAGSPHDLVVSASLEIRMRVLYDLKKMPLHTDTRK